MIASADGSAVPAALDEAIESFIAAVEADPPVSLAQYLARRYDAGLAFVGAPCGEGGIGLDTARQQLADEKLAGVGPPIPYHATANAHLFGGVFVSHGTSAQRRRYLRALYTGEERWCILLSEPDAGSDLAAIRTLALPLDDHFVVEGQKVWTSNAQVARRGLLLARHDPQAERHRGLSVFVVDMTAAGVDVRPLRQMTGDAEFNEVFLSAVVVPAEDQIGELGAGWGIMMGAIASERDVIAREGSVVEESPVETARRVWREQELDDPVLRDRLAALVVDDAVMQWFIGRAQHLPEGTSSVGTSMVMKLAYTELLQRAYELAVDLAGPEGILYPDEYEFRLLEDLSFDGLDYRRNFLASRARTIGGGTSEVLRNALAERVLGLPREPK